MASRSVTQARTTAATLIREARAAGWARARSEIKPDGSVTIDVSMAAPEGGDDFLNTDLRMGK